MDTYGIFATSPAQYFHGGYIGPVVDQLVGTAILVVLIAALIDNRNQAPAGNLLYDFFIGHVLDARAAMMRTPEPGLAPVPSTDAASGVAGPVTAEEFDEDRAA